MLHALFLVCAVWSGAVMLKALNVLRAGTPYTLNVWDGGLLRAGKQLGRRGTQLKLGVVALLFATSILALASLLPIDTARWLVMVGAALSFIGDFAVTDPPRP